MDEPTARLKYVEVIGPFAGNTFGVKYAYTVDTDPTTVISDEIEPFFFDNPEDLVANMEGRGGVIFH